MNAGARAETAAGRRTAEPDPVINLQSVTFERRASELRGWALGLYAEYRVAWLLGAEPTPGGTHAYDLEWELPGRRRPMRIQVKYRHRATSDQTRLSFGIHPLPGSDRRAGDLWVFARHTGPDHRAGWEYLVLKSQQLRRFGAQQTVSSNKLVALAPWIAESELASSAATLLSTGRKR